MLRGLCDRRLACDRDLPVLRWVLIKTRSNAQAVTKRPI
jgi:hypothetical protein